MNKYRINAYLLLIIIAGIILRLIFYTGLYSTDDYKYANYAYQTLNPRNTYKEDVQLYHHYVATNHKFFIPPQKLNFGVYIPAAVFYGLFGVKEWTTIIWPFLCSIGNIIVIFFLALIIFRNVSIGLISALLMAFFPLSSIFATRLTTDEISVFFTGLSCLAFLKSAESKNRIRWGVLSGLSLGLAYMTRCYMLIIVLFFLVYALSKRRLFSLSIPVAIGFLVIFGLENIFFLVLHCFKGLPFIFRLRVFQDMSQYVQQSIQGKGVYRLLIDFPRLMFDFKSVALYYYYFIGALCFLILKKSWRKNFIPIGWFAVIFFSLWFLPMDWRNYILPVRDTRYLSLPAIPMILVISSALYDIRVNAKQFLAYSLAGILLVSSVGSMGLRFLGPSSDIKSGKSFKVMVKSLEDIRPHLIYCDVPSVSYKINYYYRFKPSFLIKRSVTLTPEDKDVHVILHDFRRTPSLNRENIILSIKTGEILGGRTAHLQGKEFDISSWELIKVIEGDGGPYFYIFYIPVNHA